MKAKWTKSARRDRSDIFDYLAARNLLAAVATDQKILEAVQVIEHYPLAARAGRLAGTRELVIPGTRFIGVYRVDGTTPVIVRIVHTSRSWPPESV